MVSSVTCWYDLLVWGKWEYFGWWSTSAICPYLCAEKDSASDWVAYCTQMRTLWLVVTDCAICPHLLPDGIACCTILWHDSTYGYAHLLFNTVNNPSSLFLTPLPYATKSYNVFPKFHVCKQIFSTYYKWFLVELLFNIFIFRLLEVNIDVHLCFNYTVLI